VSACHSDARCDRVTLRDLLLNFVLKVRKGSTHEWVTLENLLKSRVFCETHEVMPVKSLEEATNHRFGLFS
jgi:hypothetical protein